MLIIIMLQPSSKTKAGPHQRKIQSLCHHHTCFSCMRACMLVPSGPLLSSPHVKLTLPHSKNHPPWVQLQLNKAFSQWCASCLADINNGFIFSTLIFLAFQCKSNVIFEKVMQGCCTVCHGCHQDCSSFVRRL